MSGAVSWGTAERVAVFLGAAGQKIPGRAAPPNLQLAQEGLGTDFADATEQAEVLVEAETGLSSSNGRASSRVVDRATWARTNIASFRRLIDPVLERLDSPLLSSLPVVGDALGGVARNASGAQLGVVLGWMSTKVLGQYDVLFVSEPANGLPTDGRGAQGAGSETPAPAGSPADRNGDAVMFVGPNVLSIEQRFGFPHEQFRLWVALHELTHRAQFTGVPWLREHFLSLVDEVLAGVRPDPKQLAESFRRAADAVRSGENPMGELGLIGLVAPPEQVEVLKRVQALMSLLEGHGNVTMDRAGAGLVPEAAWFSRVLRERRQRVSKPARAIQQMLGIDAKMRQYLQGERFVTAVEEAGGRELLAKVWEGPERLPTLAEIGEPALWVSRVRRRRSSRTKRQT